MTGQARRPMLWEALLPVAVAAALIATCIIRYRDDAPVPILLALACIAPAILALRLGMSWHEIEDGMAKGMTLALKASIILLVVGTTIGMWAASGTVGTMVYYGLKVLSPSWFLPAACLLCSLISLSIGSSWTTAATVGVALMGVGGALGVPPAMTAGAIISGAYFGDKMSPLSDTTNLASGIAGAKLFEHIHAMLYTTMPALCVALVMYSVLGLFTSGDRAAYDPAVVEQLAHALRAGQHVSPWLLAPPVLVIVLALFKVPAVPALVAASAFGALLAWLFQGQGLGALLSASYGGFHAETGNAAVDELLSRGGMSSMLGTIALILCATAFGGIMERGGFIQVILETLMKRVRTVGGLISATLVSCVGVNFLLADQYLAIVLPGRMYTQVYPQFGLQPRMLSRTLEDGGTVTSALCPWNSGGAFMSSTLGVATLAYVPYSFLNLLVPIIALVFAQTGLFILRTPDTQADAGAAEQC